MTLSAAAIRKRAQRAHPTLTQCELCGATERLCRHHPDLLEARGDRGRVHPLPREAGRAGRDQADQEGEGLLGLRGDVHELQPLAGQDLLAAMSERSWPPRGHEAMGWWDVEPLVGRVAVGVPRRVDRLRSLGNALVPQIAQWLGERILAYEEGAAA